MPKSPQAGSSEEGAAAAVASSSPRKTYRGLASQIVSHDEIAQEIMQRSLRRQPAPIQHEVKDVIFAMKLTQRLAHKLSPSTKDGTMSPPEASPPLLRLDQETTSSPTVASKRKASTEPVSGGAATAESGGATRKLGGGAAATPKSGAAAEAGGTTPKSANSSGKKGFRFHRQPMDPEVERELALKQLNELPTLKRSRRKTKEVVAPPSKTQEASIQTSALQQHHMLTNGDAVKLEPRPENAEKAESTCSSETKKRRSMHRELDMLLGDEGAVNMIYEAESGRDRVKARPKRADLCLKARLVKTAVIRLSSAPANLGPRARRKTEPTRPAPPEAVPAPKPEPVTPRPEDSRIIRRHSTSSSEDDAAPSPVVRRKNTPIFIKKADKSQQRPKKTASVFPTIRLQSKPQKLQSKNIDAKLRIQLKKKIEPRKKMSAAVKRSLKTVMAKNFQQGLVKKPQITAPLKAKVKLSEVNHDDPMLRSIEAQLALMVGEDPVPISPKIIASSSTGKPSGVSSKRNSVDDNAKQRSTIRQNAGVISCKELTVRRHPYFIQVILNPSSTKLRNSFNAAVLRELKNIFVQLKKDESCRVLLISSNGPSFCQGVDLHSLNLLNQDKRKKAAQELALAIKEFTKAMAAFPKPIVAAVNGSAVGLGVTMLPLCDLVLASDKATFHVPYSDLGQSLEGGASLTFPRLSGTLAGDLLYSGRKITAAEAERIGLVSRVIWHDKYNEHLMPAVQELATKSLQSLESTKNLMREALRRELDGALEAEEKLQVQHWCSSEFQKSVRKFLEAEGLHLQKGTS